MTFIDDYYRYTRVYLLRNKDEALESFIKYKTEVENQLSRTIRRLRSDRGGEYESSQFRELCEKSGIIHETTAPYTPEQNGIAERKNRTLKDMMNAMLNSSGLPLNMWGEAILSACYIQNRIPHKKTGKTPYELWKNHTPSYKHLKVWGCLAKVGLPETKKRKLGPKTSDCVFIGYAENSAAYRFLVLKSKDNILDPNTIIEARDAEFLENVFFMKSRSVEIKDISGSNLASTSKSMDISCEVELEPRRSTRARKETNLGDGFFTFLLKDDPKTYLEAIKSLDASF